MKTKILVLTLFITTWAFSQLTYVPDDNFENYLETHDKFGNLNSVNSMGNGTANDNYVLTANISSVVGLNISNLGINSLTGIKDFTSLMLLYCNDNQLSSVNLLNNVYLKSLKCSNNSLTNLNLFNNANLESLKCSNNLLTNLDLTTNLNLLEINCSNNQLTGFNIQNGNNTNIIVFDATNNPSLTCVEVDNTTFSTTNWTNIDAQTNFSHNCSGIDTYVPDNIFEYYLETHDINGNLVSINASTNMGNGVMDNHVPTAKINVVTSLNISSKNIDSLTGIEDFIALSQLYCKGNNLQTLNVTQNTALTSLSCYDNQLQNLDVSQNIVLTTLQCYGNNLQTLDVTQNTVLTDLQCSYNNLQTLDISQNTALTYLSCYDNQLQTLDVTQNIVLTTLQCDGNNLQTLDVTQNTALTYLRCSYNNLQTLDVTQNTALTNLRCYNNQLQNLDVTQNTALTYLRCYNNQLQNLDVTQNTALTNLRCSNNQLQALDVTQNTALTDLRCFENNLQTLNVTQNTALTVLYCSNNQLTTLNVKNGNNTNLTYFNAIDNPNLTCIEVDSVTYATANWTNIDVTSNFVHNQAECNALTVANVVYFENSFSIYPNPIQDILNITSNQIANYSIFNIRGQQIKKGSLFEGNNTLNVTDFPSGMYFVKIVADTNSFTKKITIN